MIRIKSFPIHFYKMASLWHKPHKICESYQDVPTVTVSLTSINQQKCQTKRDFNLPLQINLYLFFQSSIANPINFLHLLNPHHSTTHCRFHSMRNHGAKGSYRWKLYLTPCNKPACSLIRERGTKTCSVALRFIDK